MRTTPDERAEVHSNPPLRVAPEDIAGRLMAVPNLPFAPFEILGESIVPDMTNVPAVLQGTFVQVTNVGADKASLLIVYAPTAPFEFGPSSQKVVLGANYIDGDLKVFDYTEDFKKASFLFIRIPKQKTFIAGLQYYIAQDKTAAAPDPKKEAMGNRGFILFGASSGSRCLVTATVRQNFVRSLANPADIISSTAYSVPLSTGSILEGAVNTSDLFGDP